MVWPILRRVDDAVADSTGPYAKVPMNAAGLRELRLQKGWTQQTLAVRVGKRVAAVSSWERGLTEPRPSTLVRLAEVLEVQPVELLDVSETESLSLRELRVSRGMALRDLADAACTSPSTLRRWESGDFARVPGADVVRSLARAPDDCPARVEEALMRAQSLTGERH